MLLSTSTAILHPDILKSTVYTLDKIPHILKEAGFDGADWSLWALCFRDNKYFQGVLTEVNWKENILHLKEKMDAYSLSCKQTHCISVNYKIYNQLSHSQLREMEMRCIAASAILGASWTVIHPFSPFDGNSKRSIVFFSEYLKPLVEYAHKENVGIALENMIAHIKSPQRFCSTAEELCMLVDYIDDPLVGCCWDTGHANITRQNQYTSLILLGNRLKALHINDNIGTDVDLHLLPYEGNISWDQVMKALDEIDYHNDFSFEHAAQLTPAAAMPAQLCYMARLGREMLSMAKVDTSV